MEINNGKQMKSTGKDGCGLNEIQAYDFSEREKMWLEYDQTFGGESNSGKLRLQGENKFTKGTSTVSTKPEILTLVVF